VNAASATRSVERNIQLILARLRDADGFMRHVPTIDNPLKESLQ
jgi:hypothetical protein